MFLFFSHYKTAPLFYFYHFTVLPLEEYKQSGIYSLTVTNAQGCSNIVSILVMAIPPPAQPAINTSGPTTYCAGNTLTLSVTVDSAWTQKADFSGTARQSAAGFSIGTKAYVGTGFGGGYKKDFWEYDPATSAWTQKADFGGAARSGAAGFSIGTKGYIGSGVGSTYMKDFWEYNPVTNTWMQKADFGGTARDGSVGFSIGNKGYVGAGLEASRSYKKDFWEYDPTTNTWTQKADFGGSARYNTVGFSISNKGYIGTGYDGNTTKDFWEYNPATNTWTQKADFGGTARRMAVGFSMNNKGFIGTGSELNGTYKKDFWEYDPTTNSWTQKADFGGSARSQAIGFSVGNKGYIGLGINGPVLKDLWEYNPGYSYTWMPYGQTTPSITATQDGSYSIKVTNASGCSSISAATLVTTLPSPSQPVIVASGPTTFCYGSHVTLTVAAGNASVLWSNGATTPSITVTQTGTYTVTATNTSGCSVNSGAVVVTVTDPTVLPAITASGPTTFCSGESITLSTPVVSGNTWTRKADIGSTGRFLAVGFSIGNKGYIGTGTDGYNAPLNDFWEYNPIDNSWTQKANFGGGTRSNAVGFSIGNKGYVGTGDGNTGYTNDFWEYDPATNTWTQKANFGGAVRYNAVGFSIGSKGYIGTGRTYSGYAKDFWEYDPATGTWTRKADFGGGVRSWATGYGLGNKGYIGTGQDSSSTGYTNDFWEYDPANNNWKRRTDFGGGARYGAVGFGIGSKGYIGTHLNRSKDVWEYNPADSSWTRKANLTGDERSGAVGFSIGNKGYIGTGITPTVYANDFWEYNPDLTSYTWLPGGQATNAITVTQAGSYTLTTTTATGCMATSAPTIVSLLPSPAKPVITLSLPSAFCVDSITLSAPVIGNSWTQKTDFGGMERSDAVGFSIGNKGYMGTGNDQKDFWEYDPAINVWTQKADFGGGIRTSATGLSIGNKGYIGLGSGRLGTMRDFWEYNPATNTWTQKADFGGSARMNAVGFGIGTKGYIGTGDYRSDFWEYDPATNSWTQKAGFAGGNRAYAAGFGIGSKGYIGTGTLSNGVRDFWEYNPATNAWTRKADFGGGDRRSATGLSMNGKGYMGFGFNVTAGTLKDFWEYNPGTDTWLRKADFGGTARELPVAFSIGNKGYMGTGSNTKDFWEYDPSRDYQYVWSNGATSPSITAKQTGSYAVTITNGLGCSSPVSDPVMVQAIPRPVITANGPTTLCSGGSVTLSAPTGFSAYSWSNGATTAAITINQSGLYSVTVTDALGCSGTSAAKLVVVNASPATPVITISGPASFCTGGSVTLSPSVNSEPWVQKADFGGTARIGAVGFSIGSKGYVGTGETGNSAFTKDFWEYDPATNAWTQKADFGGVARSLATGFSIGTKGYIGTGSAGSGFTKDFWEYDPVTNQWAQKADFGGVARNAATGFSIGNKGYVGTGWDGGYRKDFWEYNPTTNTWTQKADFGAYWPRFGASGFSIGNKGYIGTGNYSGQRLKDFWQYDPAMNVWSQKADLGGVEREYAVGFSMGSKGYIGTGDLYGNKINDLWEYDTTANSWIQRAGSNGTERSQAVGFSMGGKAYVGTGTDGGTLMNDFREYDPARDVSYTWSNDAVTPSITVGQGGNYTVTATNALGCSSATSSPVTVTVNALPQPVITAGGSLTICSGSSVTLSAPAGFAAYSWSNSAATPAITASQAGPYTVTVTDALGCSGTSPARTVMVTASPAKPVVTASGPVNLCNGGNVTLSVTPSGDVWTQKSGMGGNDRSYAVGFNIGTKGYMGTGYAYVSNGYINLKDFWEYNPATNAWTQKADFAGGQRNNAVGFSIGNKGYVGTGNGTNDFWEYNPVTNVWIRKADFGGTGRSYAVGFSIGNKGYIGTGSGTKDFWQYDTLMDTWTRKADFSGVGRDRAAGFSIGSKGYIGTGHDGNYYRKDFWEYDTLNNTWTQKADFSGAERDGAVGLSISSKGYMGLGRNQTYEYNYQRDFWEYNVVTNSWLRKQDFSAGVRAYATGFSIADKGYIGSGAKSTSRFEMTKDVWEYDPEDSYNWSPGGQTGNTITVTQSGSYSVTVSNRGCTSPASDPVVVAINALLKPIITANGPTAFCSGGSVTLSAPAGFTSYFWSNGATTQSIIITQSGSYTVSVTNSSSCSSPASDAVIVTVNTVPAKPAITASGPITFCSGGSVTLTATLSTSYLWSNGAITQSITVNQSGSYTVTVKNSNGCSSPASDVVNVTVNALPPTPTVSVTQLTCGVFTGTITVNNPMGAGITYSINGTTYQSSNVFNNLAPGNYSVTAKNSSACVSAAFPVTITATTTDKQAPNITLKPSPTVFLNVANTYTVQLSDVLQSVADNCDPNPNTTVSTLNITCANLGAGGSPAPHQAYISNTSTGNDDYLGEFGLRLSVNSASGIVINKLGAFDHQGNGISGTQGGGVRVAIFNVNTQTIVPGLDATISGTSDLLVGNYRMRSITPVTLPAGNYVMVVKGYTTGELFYNRHLSGPLNPTGDNAAGALSFLNTIYYGPNVANGFSFPNNSLDAGNPNEYVGGTFNYSLSANNSVVMVTATDVSGNTSTATTTVTVVDTFYVLTTKNISVNLNATGHATLVPADVLQSLKNNCGIDVTSSNLQVSPSSFSCADANGSTATHQAYVSNTSTGNDDYLGEFGLRFSVNSASGVIIDKLGAFDHQGNGISGTQGGGVRVAIFNVNTRTIVPGLDATIVGTANPLVGNYRMRSITPVTLPAGNYVMVVKGYTAGELFYNRHLSGPLNPTGDNGSGALSFLNTIYYGPNVSNGFSFPTNSLDAGNPNEYVGGTFNYNLFVAAGTLVTLTATDVYGHQKQATATVVVRDNTEPVITTKNITLNLDASGHASLQPNDVLQSPVTDNCGVQSVMVSPNSFTCADYSAGGNATPHQAYVSNTSTGNDDYLGEFGLRFSINSASGIVINKLGAFDHQGNGISGTQGGGVRVAIFNVNTQTIVPGLDATIVGTANPLVGNYRMRSITPVTLPAGNYVMVVKGYTTGELFYNRHLSGPLNPTGDNGSGALSFLNTIYYGPNVSNGFSFPNNSLDAGNSNEYVGGTFSYSTSVSNNKTVTITATDTHGNVTNAIATVTLTDPNHSCTPPVMTYAAKSQQTYVPVALDNLSMTVKVYPNPSNGQFTVQLFNLKVPKVTLQIMDVDGQMIEQKAATLTGKTPLLSIPVDISKHASGIYLIKIISADDIQTAKVVVGR